MFILIRWCYKWTLKMLSTLFFVRLYFRNCMMQVGNCFSYTSHPFFHAPQLLFCIVTIALMEILLLYLIIRWHLSRGFFGCFLFALVQFHALYNLAGLFLFCLFPFVVNTPTSLGTLQLYLRHFIIFLFS